MDFKSAAELLKLCEEENLPISQVMRRREMSERSEERRVGKECM